MLKNLRCCRVTPPGGTLTAIHMNKASIAWQVPLGEVPWIGADGHGEP